MAFPTSMCGTPRAISSNGVTTVDCQKQVRSWRLLRSLMELLIPSCKCSTFIEDQDIQQQEEEENNHLQNCNNSQYPAFSTSSSTTIVGTIFGFRHGKVRLCIQTSYNSTNPVLLLQLAVPTTTLAREMQGGILRIALESTATRQGFSTADNSCSLLSMPVWKMYCNGRKVGFAVKRQPSKADMEALRVMSADHVLVGAGVISGKELQREDELMYLRANFERVCGSANSESFHLIDQDGSSTSTSQELSIFFFRSR
ncbi:protein MIZU-KUSSEI 1-like [Juglans microcarpa x Juglans regia]|uniref:protein MIZU-KUSSEI 1-like n=1 Tax=Juglans microcarpa x Juglans regia TaxID=2249226 RepID=UPI001B7F26C0|nr:protein MIZU-KUSSEI 1-like [Juglans microcarpa x Juglans regia]